MGEETMIALILIFAASASASIEANPDPKMIKVIQEQTADVAERSLIILLNDTVGICMMNKTAFDLGRKTKEEELCESVFPCGKEINLPTEDEVMARVAVPECSELNMVCPGLSIGCSLCGGHIPALCGPMCPLAGLFCGSSGYFCQFQN